MRILIVILSILTLQSCIPMGYGFNGADICEQCKTVSIAYFDNNAANVNPELSQRLTEAIKDKFNNETPLTLVTRNADLQFSGHISRYQVTSVAVQGNETAAMNRLTIDIQVIYENIHEEEKNFETKFSRYADFESSRNLGDVEGELMDQIIEQLVQDIFNKSVVNW